MSLKLGTLYENRDQIPTLASWFEDEWPDQFSGGAGPHFEERCNAETLPLALVMFDGDTLVGTIAIEREGPAPLADRSPWLTGLFVPKEHRSRGIGQLLITAASRVAFGSGAETVHAAPPPSAELEEVLKDLGWREISEPADAPTAFEFQRPPSPPSFYDLIGGESKVRELVDRFYDLMDQLDEAAPVRAMHAKSLRSSRQKLFEFLSGWMGGPNLYIEKRGHPRLRMRHMPFEIGTEARDQWLLCMDQALNDVVADDDVREQLKDSFARIADHMRNRRGP